MAKKSAKPSAAGSKLVVQNKRAGFNYHIEEKIEAGMVLVGSEVKSARLGKVQLVDAYAAIEKGQVYLHKAHIAEYAQGGPHFNHVTTRKRKLLLHRRQIATLKAKMEQQGYSLVPTRVYFKRGLAKIELGLGKGKNKGDKRRSVKEKESVRSMDRARKRDRD